MSSQASTTQKILTDEMVEAIKSYFPRYPDKQAVTLPALHIVNDRLRYVPRQAVIEIAELLELAPADVQDTLTFYGYFKQDKPHGEHRAWVCRSVSCALRGGEEVMEHLCQHLNVKPGEVSEDGKFTIEEAECLGACDFAPCMLVNDDLHQNISKDGVEGWVKAVREK